MLLGFGANLFYVMNHNKTWFYSFIFMAIILTIINIPVIGGDFNFNPNTLQQTILESNGLTSAVKIDNDFNSLKIELINKKYFNNYFEISDPYHITGAI